MTYLTRMKLHPRRRGTARLLDQPRAMHAAVASSFPPGHTTKEEGTGRVLWRIDRHGHDISLYIVSPTIPSLEHIHEQAGWAGHTTWETANYEPFLDGLTQGRAYRFRLRANPIHQVDLPTGKSKKLAHVTAQQQTQWLIDRAPTYGFALRSHPASDDTTEHNSGEQPPIVTVSNRATLNFRHDQGRVTLATAQFDGELEVTDPEALRRALTHGIGRGKAYGNGLMTLAPLN